MEIYAINYCLLCSLRFPRHRVAMQGCIHSKVPAQKADVNACKMVTTYGTNTLRHSTSKLTYICLHATPREAQGQTLNSGSLGKHKRVPVLANHFIHTALAVTAMAHPKCQAQESLLFSSTGILASTKTWRSFLHRITGMHPHSLLHCFVKPEQSSSQRSWAATFIGSLDQLWC